MSTKSDPTQGMVPYKQPKATPVPTPNGTKIIAAAGRAVNEKYASDHAPRPPQRVGGLVDWRRG
jgi:hypothetical protein